MKRDRVEITAIRAKEIVMSYKDPEELAERIILEIQDAYADGLHDGMDARDDMIREFLGE